MYTRKHWNILIVDDEEDIHTVTKLSLKKEQVYGSRLQLHHAKSAAEAQDLLLKNPRLTRAMSVALIDVVMETDQAGLQLCKFIRETLRRQAMQLILRTGQPGQAPPRKIIDDYNISGYLTKLEASGDRLYMAIKGGVQQYYETTLNEAWSQALDAMREAASTPEQFLELLKQFMSQDFGSEVGQEFHGAYDFFGEHYVGAGYFKDKAVYDAMKDDLLKRASSDLGMGAVKASYGANVLSSYPNRVAKVDGFSVIQAKVIGSDKLATLVIKDPSCPRDMLWFYGALWRQSLAYMAQVLLTRR